MFLQNFEHGFMYFKFFLFLAKQKAKFEEAPIPSFTKSSSKQNFSQHPTFAISFEIYQVRPWWSVGGA